MSKVSETLRRIADHIETFCLDDCDAYRHAALEVSKAQREAESVNRSEFARMMRVVLDGTPAHTQDAVESARAGALALMESGYGSFFVVGSPERVVMKP